MSRSSVSFRHPSARLHNPEGLLTLEEVRSRMERPPAEPVEWIGTCVDDGREVRTYAQLWKSARAICAARLGVNEDRVTCIRADEQRLNGAGVA
jgi:hypothetical protein